MQVPQSRAVAQSLEWRESCPSTNSELVARAAQLDDLTVLATDTQTAGKGRLGRTWSAPAGSALAVSVFVRQASRSSAALATPPRASSASPEAPATPPDPRRLGWLPLVAGVAMCRAAHALGVPRASVKWPNDVLVDGRKLSGILTELTPHGVVIGAGLNLTMQRDELPVPTATSLALEGASVDDSLTDRALDAYLSELLPLIAMWRSAHDPAELRGIVQPHLHTLGLAVRVDRPALPVLLGTAVELDDDGCLVVQPTDPSSTRIAVAAGDVTHLRYE
ncbi:MAG: biotin--[acetyl-CoA-carboxylase] ligase [Microcella sp.]|uniref:biotin--[acetyl-CoA-carboxylase] ligase n=1 Tax=Microcella sp. TaxID=1913979 RepID=UPI0024C9AE09|nr:biotin--[acetyl-CoA-carboxylase] ligase [Microcella sp.]UYN82607.1 MAG: biotin--[acetyl-CoA-carboxylase] ligase [Microcella sp.]